MPGRLQRLRRPCLTAVGLLLCACTQLQPLAPGCRGTSTNSGGNSAPPSYCFFFPSGLMVDPMADLLYVTNSNGDLSFSGGNLVSVDLARHERAASCFKKWKYSQPTVNPASPDVTCGIRDCAPIRAMLAAAPINNYFVTSDSVTMDMIDAVDQQILGGTYSSAREDPAVYDRCYCEQDTLDPTIANCESHRFVVREQTVITGNFSGDFTPLIEDPLDWRAYLAAPSPAPVVRTLYLPVRGDPSLTFVQTQRQVLAQPLQRPITDQTTLASTTLAALRNPFGLYMNCGGGPGQACDTPHRVQQTPLGDGVYVDSNDVTQGIVPRILLPPEPFDATVDTGCKTPGQTYIRYYNDGHLSGPACVDGNGVYNRDVYRTLIMAHLASGNVTAFNLNGTPALPVPVPFTDDRLSGPGVPTLTDIRNMGFPANGSGQQGAFAVAVRVPGDRSQPWYVTTRLSAQINSFRLGTDLMPLLTPVGYDTDDPTAWSALSAAQQAATTLYVPVQGPDIFPGLVFTLNGALPTGGSGAAGSASVRDLFFEPGGNRAFLVLSQPSAIVVLDTTLDELSTPPGSPRNQVLQTVNIGPGPSRAALSRAPLLDSGQLRTLLYVAEQTSGNLTAVDPDNGTQIADFLIGRSPIAVAINYGGPSDGGHMDPCADPYVNDTQPGVSCPLNPATQVSTLRVSAPRAYVTEYLDNVVAVVDLDPRSPSYHQVVSRIGVPAPKSQ